MIIPKIAPLSLCLALLAGACATPQIDPSLLSPMPEAGPDIDGFVRPGDVLEVGYYRDIERADEPYAVGVADVLRVDVFERAPAGSEGGAYRIGVGDTLRVDIFENRGLKGGGGPYRVGIGDVVSVEVFEHPEISRERAVVLPDGMLSLPLIGSASASGKTIDELNGDLEILFSQKGILDPVVTVSVEEGDRTVPLPGLSREEVIVLPDGTISLPLVGTVEAAGRTVARLGSALAEAYAAQGISTPQVTVAVDDRGEDALRDDLSRETVTVLGDGSISLPLIGRIQVADKNVAALSDDLGAAYQREGISNARVTVAVVEDDRRLRDLLESVSAFDRTALSVRVSNAGVIDLPFVMVAANGRTLGDVRTEIAERYDEKFGGRLKTTVALSEPTAREVYVMGEVENPGRVEFLPPFNPLTAVAAAGGFREPEAYPESVLVVRFKPDGSYDQWVFNLMEGLENGTHDAGKFQVRHGDVIYVPRAGIARANDNIEQYIRRMLPINLGAGLFFDVGNSD